MDSTPLFDEQSLHLLKAFFKIRDAEARDVVIRLAQLLAPGSQIDVAATSERVARPPEV